MSLVLAGRGGGGGKGGGGGATTGRVPVEDPNTLRSRATARVVDLVSEGPIVGLVDGAKSIFFDDTPLQNADGSFNFQNVAWSTRAGEPDQDPIPGFADVEATVAVGVEVTQAAPVTRTLGDPDLDAVRIILRIPALTRQDTATGDIRATSVRIAIDVQPDGGSFSQIVDDTITGKTVSPYERSYRVELPSGGAPWTVRMRRITPDSDAATVTDKTFFAAYVTIVDNRLVYPDSALVAPAVDAQAFGGRVPARAYEMDLLILDVPSNYDALARSYDGDWDGTFIQSWTSNPAWVLYGLLTNPRWGLGLDPDAVDKWELYRIAQYCDEAVEDGFGGEEPRFAFNYVINHAEDAYALVQAVASSFRGIVYWAAGTVVVTADMPEDPVALVAPANAVDGRFDYAGSGLKARHTVALVTWFDPEDGYRPAPEIVEDAAGIERFGAREANVVAIGCTSRGQAARAGRWLLDSEAHETETVTYRAAWDHAQVRPGNIVAVADPAYAGVRFGGRLAGFDAGTATVTLDAPVMLGAGETYTLSLVQANGTLFDAAVTSPAGETATLTLADVPEEAPVPGAMWVLTGSDVAPRLFRVVAVREVEAHLYEVTALVHDGGKYARIEQGLVLDPPSFTALPTGRLVPPSGISAVEYLYRIGPGLRSAVTVSWTASPDARIVLHELQARPPEAEYRPAGTSVTTTVDLMDVGEGVWGFRVRGLDAAGRPSPWAELPGFLVASVAGTPADVAGFTATVIDDMATLAWDESPDLRVVHYRIRYSPQTDGASWGSAVVLVDRIAATSVQVPATAGTWLIKAVGPTGKESANAALIVSTVALVQGLNVVELVEEAPAFAGDGEGVEVDAGMLRLDDRLDDFRDGALPAGVGIDRDTAATHVIDGVVIGVAADEARLSEAGVLVERGSGNGSVFAPNLSNHYNYNVSWTTDHADPLGSNAATRQVNAAVNDFHASVRILSGLPAGQVRTFSICARLDDAAFRYLWLVSDYSSHSAVFDLETRTFAGFAPGKTGDIGHGVELLADGWARYWLAYTITGSQSATFFGSSTSATSHAGLGSGTGGVFLYGRQDEALPKPTSLMVSGPRDPDELVRDVGHYDLSGALTLAAEFTAPPADGLVHVVAQIDDNGTAVPNLIVAPEDLADAAWTANGVTVAADEVAAPDGTLTADRIVETAADAVHEVSQAIAGTEAGTTHTLSAFFRAAEKDTGLVVLAAPAGQYIATRASLVDGTILAADAGGGMVRTGGGAEEVSPGWWRIRVTGYSPDQTTLFAVLAIAGGVYVGTAGAGVYVWGAKLSVGGLSGYLPGTDERIRHVLVPDGASGYDARVIVTAGGADVADLDLGPVTPGVLHRIASSHSAGAHGASLDGAAAVTAAGALPSGLDTLRYGHDHGPANHLDARLALLSLRPGTLASGEELAALSVPGSLAHAFPASGTYAFAGGVDLGAVYTSRLTADLAAHGEDVASVMASWPTLAGVETLSGADPSAWSVAIEMQATADDPEDEEAAWSDWRRLVIGDHTARAFRFRAVLATALPTVTPVVEALSVEIDMPDRVVAGEDILVPEEGHAVAFDPPFLALAGIGIGAQDLATGDRWSITDKGASGFTIRFFNAGDTPVARTTDYVAKGHGRLIAGA